MTDKEILLQLPGIIKENTSHLASKEEVHEIVKVSESRLEKMIDDRALQTEKRLEESFSNQFNLMQDFFLSQFGALRDYSDIKDEKLEERVVVIEDRLGIIRFD